MLRKRCVSAPIKVTILKAVQHVVRVLHIQPIHIVIDQNIVFPFLARKCFTQ